MKGEVTVTVHTENRVIDADELAGEHCKGCNDVIYFRAKALSCTVYLTSDGKTNQLGTLCYPLCESCAQVAKDCLTGKHKL